MLFTIILSYCAQITFMFSIQHALKFKHPPHQYSYYPSLAYSTDFRRARFRNSCWIDEEF